MIRRVRYNEFAGSTAVERQLAIMVALPLE